MICDSVIGPALSFFFNHPVLYIEYSNRENTTLKNSIFEASETGYNFATLSYS